MDDLREIVGSAVVLGVVGWLVWIAVRLASRDDKTVERVTNDTEAGFAGGVNWNGRPDTAETGGVGDSGGGGDGGGAD